MLKTLQSCPWATCWDQFIKIQPGSEIKHWYTFNSSLSMFLIGGGCFNAIKNIYKEIQPSTNNTQGTSEYKHHFKTTDTLSDPRRRWVRNVRKKKTSFFKVPHKCWWDSVTFCLYLATSCKSTWISVDLEILYECRTNSNCETWKQAVSDTVKWWFPAFHCFRWMV